MEKTEKINVLCIGLSYFKEALVYDPDCQKLKKEFDFVFCDGDEELNTVFQEGRKEKVRFKTAILHPSKCKDAQGTVVMLEQIFPRIRLGIVTGMIREEFVYIDAMNEYAPDFFSGPPDSDPEFIYSQFNDGRSFDYRETA